MAGPATVPDAEKPSAAHLQLMHNSHPAAPSVGQVKNFYPHRLTKDWPSGSAAVVVLACAGCGMATSTDSLWGALMATPVWKSKSISLLARRQLGIISVGTRHNSRSTPKPKHYEPVIQPSPKNDVHCRHHRSLLYSKAREIRRIVKTDRGEKP